MVREVRPFGTIRRGTDNELRGDFRPKPEVIEEVDEEGPKDLSVTELASSQVVVTLPPRATPAPEPPVRQQPKPETEKKELSADSASGQVNLKKSGKPTSSQMRSTRTGRNGQTA